MSGPNRIDRRKALVVVAAAPIAVALSSCVALGEDAELCELWRRYIDLELKIGDLCNAADEASWDARQEVKALEAPWKPKECEFKSSEERKDGERILTFRETGPTKLKDGVWHVLEGQLDPRDPERYVSAERWQPYPTAKTAEEAYAMSEARAAKELRSLRSKRAAISRKHGVRKTEAATSDAHEASRSIRSAIAKAQATSAAAIAVKLAMYFDGGSAPTDADPDGRFDEIEAAGIESIYRHAVAECGFDPLADLERARGRRT
jgi:hypothetical protein